MVKSLIYKDNIINIESKCKMNDLEIKINISLLPDDRKKLIGDFLYYNKDIDESFNVNESEFNTINNLLNPLPKLNINYQLSKEDIIYLKSELKIIISYQDVYDIRLLNNFLVKNLEQLVNIINSKTGILNYDLNYLDFRSHEIFTYFYSKNLPIPNICTEIVNEYQNKLKIYNLLLENFNDIETYYFNNLIIYNYFDYHPNVGYVNFNNKIYIYKNINFIKFNTFELNINSINNYYNFIKSCNLISKSFPEIIKFDDTNNVIIDFVFIHNIIIFSKYNNDFNVGYLMDKINGKTLRDIELNTINKNKIIFSLVKLGEKLSFLNFLIVDLNDDNIMWNDESNTLTLIDISISSFNKNNELVKQENNITIQNFIILLIKLNN